MMKLNKINQIKILPGTGTFKTCAACFKISIVLIDLPVDLIIGET